MIPALGLGDIKPDECTGGQAHCPLGTWTLGCVVGRAYRGAFSSGAKAQGEGETTLGGFGVGLRSRDPVSGHGLPTIPPRLQVLIRSGQVPIVSLECVSCKAQGVYAVSRSSYVYLEGRCDNCSGGAKRGVSWWPGVRAGLGWAGLVQALEVTAAAAALPLSARLRPTGLGCAHLQQPDTGAG